MISDKNDMGASGSRKPPGNDKEIGEPTERIGVLAVHGIGEQRRGQHLDKVAKALATVWKEQHKPARVVAHGKREGVISIDICGPDLPWRRVEIREVYWADADEDPRSLVANSCHTLHFWIWGLSQWRCKFVRNNASPHTIMSRPKRPSRTHWVRLRLFGVAVCFLLLGLTWEVARFLLRRLTLLRNARVSGSGVLVRYIGDVQLYMQKAYRWSPQGALPMDRPRDLIRRRMVHGLVEMASKKYDRWYVVAHSQGSVVAHNGLMEHDAALANYFDAHAWKNTCPNLRTGNAVSGGQDMLPSRPCWLADDDGISRKALFEKLKGFITYGSPLDKFATLWPHIVLENKDRSPLQDCKWFNIFDPMDPVAGKLDLFGSSKGFKPKNVPYKASCPFILAHISYLGGNSLKDTFRARLAETVLSGKPFSSAKSGRFKVNTNARTIWRFVWWSVVGLVAATLLIFLICKLLGIKLALVSVGAVAVVAPLIAGLAVRPGE